MSSANTALEIELEGVAVDKPAAVLRGSARGLEIVVDGKAALVAIVDAMAARLAEAPTFFKGSDVRIRVEDGPLPAGSLGLLDDIATQFGLRIVELLAAVEPPRRKLTTDNAIPVPTLGLAAGSSPNDFDDDPPTDSRGSEFDDDPPTDSRGVAFAALDVESRAALAEFDDALPTRVGVAPPTPNAIVMATAEALAPVLRLDLEGAFASARAGLSWVAPPPGAPAQPLLPLMDAPPAKRLEAPRAEAPQAESVPTADQLELALKRDDDEPEIEIVPGTRIVIGPVRSGVILDHVGHVIVFGDVNPGAEVRAAGNIVVLGRLRGTAHAGIGADAGFILALRLQPQQLRIGRLVARASDSDTPDQFPEIAHVAPTREGAAIVVERYQGRLPNGLASSLL